MRFGQDVLTDLPRALAHQWLLGNGLGGSSLGDAAAAGGRREHAWLVTPGSGGARVALLGLDERLTVGDATFDLATRPRAGGEVRPAGHAHLESFALDPWPVWRWRVGGVTLERSLFLVEAHHALVVSWRLVEGGPARLVAAPLLVARAPHELQREDPAFRGVVKGQPGRIRFETVDGEPALTVWHNGVLLPARLWQRDLVHPLDPPAPSPAGRSRRDGAARRAARRDEPPAGGEEALAAAYLEARLAPGGSLHVVAATEDDLFKALAHEGRLGAPPPHTLAGCVAVLEAEERERLGRLLEAAREGADLTARQAIAAHGATPVPRRSGGVLEPGDPWVARLPRALDAGLVRRGHRTTLLAGLPHGEERGLAALRALPGLITLRAFEPAAAVLRGMVEYLDEGFVPERFDADGAPHYGDPAPSLWLVHAAELLARRNGDLELVRDGLYPSLESVMQYFRAGTRGGVRVDTDGLLSVGEGDAAEKPAGLNTLWYHALVAMAQLARLVGRRENSAFYLAWAHDHQRHYLEALWDAGRGTLYRALTPAGPVPGERPDHLLAIALPPSLLPGDRAARLLAHLESVLFTPLGLRPAPGAAEADPAWLGAFHTAYLRVHGRSAEAQAQVRDRLARIAERIGGCGQVPAQFLLPGDGGMAGAHAAGDLASVPAAAELLRVWIEELDHADSAALVG